MDPKKVLLCLLRGPPSSRHLGPVTQAPSSASAQGAKDLEESSALLDSLPPATASGGGRTFLVWTQKKSPFFSAPKKPKKSPIEPGIGTLRKEKSSGGSGSAAFVGEGSTNHFA